jgi:SOS-response transcriptional repressor LexA
METRAQRRLRKLNELCTRHRERGGVAFVAELAGLSANTLDQVLKGALLPPKMDGTRSPRTLGDNAASAIEDAFELGRGWFDNDEGLNICGTGSVRVAARIQGYSVEPGPELRARVPLISWVQAGDWNGASDPLQPGDAERWLDCPTSHSDRTYALRVRGDSMTSPHGNARTYPEGCIVFVDPLRRSPVNGERVIAKLEGSDEVTFKVFKQEDGRIWLQPINPMHDKLTQPFKVLGTIIGKWEDE